MNIIRDPDVLFVLMWLAGCIITAGLVETIKAGMTKPYKWLWRVLAGIFILITTLSAWYGVDGHSGNMNLIPIWLVGGYYLQLVIDMKVIKKIVAKVVARALEKKGIDYE